MGEGGHERQRAAVLATIIVDAPVADADRAVDHDRRGLEFARHQRRQVDEGLERGARLALRVGGAVELRGAVVAPAHDGLHGAVRLHDDAGALLGMVGGAVLPQFVLDGGFRLLLQVRVERGLHRQHAIVAELAAVDELAHLVIGVVEVPVGRNHAGAVDRRRGVEAGAVDLRLAHVARIDEVRQHVVGPRARGRQVDVGRVFGGRFEESGQHGGLGQGHLAHRFAEVELRGGLNAEGAAAHVDAVEVELEDLALGEMRLEPEGQEGLVDLAGHRALVRQEQVLGELLGDRGAALHDARGARIDRQRPQGADHVDAEMGVEAAVLRGEHGLGKVGRHLGERHAVVVQDAAAADLDAVVVEEGDREVGLLQPIVGDVAVDRKGERQEADQADDAEVQALAGEVDGGPAPAAHGDPVGPGLARGVKIARLTARFEHRGIEPRVDGEHRAGHALAETGEPGALNHAATPSAPAQRRRASLKTRPLP